MARYHVNPETGNASACRATKSCPFGGEADHFATKAEAQASFEQASGAGLASLTRGNARIETGRATALSHWRVKTIPPAADGTTFEQAWNAYFSPLTEPQLPAVDTEKVLREELGNPDFGRERGGLSLEVYDDETDEYVTATPEVLANPAGRRFAAVIHTRNGGGNKECWCEDESHPDGPCTAAKHDTLTEHASYLYDEEDDFDRTYTTYYFSIDVSKHDYGSLLKQEEAYRAQDGRARILEMMEDGEMAPWQVMPVNKATEKAAKESWARYREETAKTAPQYYGSASTRPTEEHLKDLRAIEKAVKEGKPLPKLEASWGRGMRSSLSSVDRYRRDRERAQEELEGLVAARDLHSKGQLPDSVARALTGRKTFDEAIGAKEDKIADLRRSSNRAFDSYLGREKARVAEVVKHAKTVGKLREEHDRLQAATHWHGDPKTLPKKKA